MSKKKNEEGAVVVEAALAVPVYIFLIITILAIVNICYAQAKIQIALNTAAKQVSQCMYIYYATDANTALQGDGGTSSGATSKVSDFMIELMSKFGFKNDFLTNFAEALGGTSIAGIIEGAAMTGTLQLITESVLKNADEDSAAAFYKRMNIVEGSPSFVARLIAGGSDNSADNKKTLIVGMHYEIELIKLFDTEVTIEMFNSVTTGMWSSK